MIRGPTPDFMIAHMVGNLGYRLRAAQGLARVYEMHQATDRRWHVVLDMLLNVIT